MHSIRYFKSELKLYGDLDKIKILNLLELTTIGIEVYRNIKNLEPDRSFKLYLENSLPSHNIIDDI
jgi:hypothetical protein